MNRQSIKTAVYAGTFDPPTNGHLDIILQGLSIFDSLIVLVAVNPEKRTLFSVEERLSLLKEALGDRSDVLITSSPGLTVDFALSAGAVALIRGIRGPSEFEYEQHMAMMNRSLRADLPTVLLLPREENLAIHSSLIRSLAALHAPISRYVPDCVEKALHEKFSVRGMDSERS